MTRPLTHLRDELRREMVQQRIPDEQIDAAVNLFFRKNLVSGDLSVDPSNISLLMVPEGLNIRLKFFETMSKCIIESAAHDFYTCDDPVTWRDPFRKKPVGFDYFSISAEVTYPLTRRHCLVMSYFPLKDRVSGDAGTVSVINARTAGNALREVYAHPKDSGADTARFVEDILSIPLRDRPLLPFVIGDAGRGKPPDIGALADALGMERWYIIEINRAFIEYLGSSVRSKRGTEG